MITPNAFNNIQTDELRITNSSLNDSMIDPHAFRLLATTLKKLDLSNNDLTKLPIALKELTNVSSLDVSWESNTPTEF